MLPEAGGDLLTRYLLCKLFCFRSFILLLEKLLGFVCLYSIPNTPKLDCSDHLGKVATGFWWIKCITSGYCLVWMQSLWVRSLVGVPFLMSVGYLSNFQRMNYPTGKDLFFTQQRWVVDASAHMLEFNIGLFLYNEKVLST